MTTIILRPSSCSAAGHSRPCDGPFVIGEGYSACPVCGVVKPLVQRRPTRLISGPRRSATRVSPRPTVTVSRCSI